MFAIPSWRAVTTSRDDITCSTILTVTDQRAVWSVRASSTALSTAATCPSHNAPAFTSHRVTFGCVLTRAVLLAVCTVASSLTSYNIITIIIIIVILINVNVNVNVNLYST